MEDSYVIDDDYQALREVLGTRTFPIYRHRILVRRMQVYGLWWIDTNHWARFLWRGHNAEVLKSGQDPDRVLTSLKMCEGSCYARIMDDRVDLEGIVQSTKWDIEGGRKFHKKRSVYEWLTVSVTMEEYENLVDTSLGPPQDVCHRHK